MDKVHWILSSTEIYYIKTVKKHTVETGQEILFINVYLRCHIKG